MKHRNTDYGVAEDPMLADKWRYTIYPTMEVGPKVVSSDLYSSYEEAEAACRNEIDLGLSGANIAQRS
jgi:hypothetical protein